MAKTPRRSGERWTSGEISDLKKMAKENTPTRVIAMKIGRTPEAIKSKANEVKLSLKPTNQSPYNKRKPR